MRPMPAGAVREETAARTECGKLYTLESGAKQLVVTQSPQHLPTDLQAYEAGLPTGWIDFDLDFYQFPDGGFGVKSAWYTCYIEPQHIHWTYQSLRYGRVQIWLTHLGTVEVEQADLHFEPVIDGSYLRFLQVVPDLDLVFEAKKSGLFLYKILHSDQAPREFTWMIEQPEGSPLNVNTETIGRDNHLEHDPTRARASRRNRCRPLDMRHEIELLSTTRREFRESWTGRTFERDDEGRRGLRDDCVYPAWIDQDVTEPITATVDDGYESTFPSFYNANIQNFFGYYVGNTYLPFFRFQTVAIPNAQLIDNATLTIEVLSLYNGGNTMTVFGYDTDSSAPWSSPAVLPSMVPRTSASTTAVLTAAGTVALDVTGIVQEIVARGQWPMGGNLSFFLDDPVTVGGNYGGYIEDYTNAGTNEAVLTVTFAPAPSMSERLAADGDRTRLIRWSLGPDDDGAPVVVSERPDMSVQVTGTFDGATVSIQGSNDGIVWASLVDYFGNALDFTADGFASIGPRTWKVRPLVTGGTTTAVTVDLLLGA